MAGEIVMPGNKKTTDASPIYWKSGVIRKVCLSPKAAEMKALIRPLLESIENSRQIEEKDLRC